MRKLLLALLLALPALARAGGYAVINVNPRDLALVGSAVAAQADAAAVFGNPAALAGLAGGLHLSLGASAIDFRSDWKDPNGSAAASADFHPALPPALYAAWVGRLGERGWAVGAGMTVPFGGNVFWPGDWAGRSAILSVDRRVYGGYLTGGFELLKQLRLGGGLVYYRTTEHLKQGTDFLQASPASFAEIGAAGGQLSFDLSAEAQPFADLPFKIGVDYKHQAVQKLTGKAHFSDVPASLRQSLLDQDATHILTVPNTVQVGASCRLSPGALLTAEWSWDRFKVYREDRFVGSLGTTLVVPRNYRNGYTFRLGGELTASPGLLLRAGLLRDIAPTPPAFLNASIPDADSWGVGLGASYAVTARLALQGSWFFARMDRVTTTGTQVLPGTYSTSASILALGLVWSPAAAP